MKGYIIRYKNKMMRLKKYWLEVIFGVVVTVVLYFTATNALYWAGHVQIDYGKKLKQSNIKITSTQMADYLKEIQEIQNATTVIVVKDIQGYCLNQDIVDELENMGFDQADILLEETYHSFIGIVNDGEVVYQRIGGDEHISFGGFVDKHYVYAVSATHSAGNTGEVYVDDISYAVNNRGFNIVTFSNEDDILYDSVAYDTYLEEIPICR